MGIPEYREPKEPGTGGWFKAWRCRRNGGHFEGTAYVNHGRLVSLSRVCSRCNRYLGPILPEVYEDSGDLTEGLLR